MSETYTNILKDLKGTSEDFKWVTRPINFFESYKQDRPKISPTELKLLVYNSNYVTDTVKKVSHKINGGDEEVKDTIMSIVSEIGFAYELPVIRWLGYIVVKILRKSLSGIFVNESRLNELKVEMKSSPVVFVPTHRSYCDFILMAFVCFTCNISIPCVAAGMDFLSMKFMGQLLRQSKAFFMRRSFADDPVYRTVFREYIKILISFQNSPVEFFIEGTRSRTGKSIMPKFGLLTMLVEAFLSGEIPDIKIIPINISYERILEEKLFAHELMGIPKPKESTLGLLRGLQVMDRNYGKVFVTFGESLSIRDYFNKEEDNRFIRNDFETSKIRTLAHRIIKQQRNLQNYGSFNILSLILSSCFLKSGSHAIALNDAVKQFETFLILFNRFGASVFIEEEIEGAIRESIRLHSSLVRLTSDNYIELKNNEDHFHLKANDFSYSASFVPYIMLQIYVNPTLNLYIREAILVIAINCLNSRGDAGTENILPHYQYLNNLLKHEFVLDFNMEEFTNCISRLYELQIIEGTSNSIKIRRNSVFKDCFVELVLPFFTGIYSICTFLKDKQILERNLTDLKKILQFHMVSCVRDGLIVWHYAASFDFISNTLNSLIDLGVIFINMDKECSIIKEPLDFAISYLDCLINCNDYNMLLKKQKSELLLKNRLLAKL